ncbi:disulfide bond formation protein B [Aureimonas pseudogalii]|uniref:Disulfide bond formation protein DsbB n=1 Tax=Aureimonas pseudogalii TaxID=1744844 RepID=A0A7W6E7R9_9HYPH|nr:disulfide bond formation protein B [Aureimonas pseudogalii]MBB3996295.1 disulfide bond formation protein DsbB [Aureimonas pseudogalii]
MLRKPCGFRQTLASLLLVAGMSATVGGALLFQHVGGYIPCALCLEQRTPYYLAIPLALAALLARLLRAPAPVVRGLLLVVGGLMLWGMGLGIYHAGVEWALWAGPTDCAMAAPVDLTGDLLSTLDSVHAPSCSEAALRILGLSLAGWNAILAALFAAVALRAALTRGDRFA